MRAYYGSGMAIDVAKWGAVLGGPAGLLLIGDPLAARTDTLFGMVQALGRGTLCGAALGLHRAHICTLATVDARLCRQTRVITLNILGARRCIHFS